MAFVKNSRWVESIKSYAGRIIVGPVYSQEELAGQMPQIREYAQEVFNSLRPFKTQDTLWSETIKGMSKIIKETTDSKSRQEAFTDAFELIERYFFRDRLTIAALNISQSQITPKMAEQSIEDMHMLLMGGMRWAVIQDDPRFKNNLYYPIC